MIYDLRLMIWEGGRGKSPAVYDLRFTIWEYQNLPGLSLKPWKEERYE